MLERPKEHLLDELRTVEENSLHASQAHQAMAKQKVLWVRALLVAASAVSALAGFLVLIGSPTWLGALSAAGGLTVAIATAFGIDRNGVFHDTAATRFSDLEQEARTLRETFAHEIDHPMLVSEVRRASDKYRNLLHFSPPLGEKAPKPLVPARTPLPPPVASSRSASAAAAAADDANRDIKTIGSLGSFTPSSSASPPGVGPLPPPLDFPPVGGADKPIKGPFD